MFLFHYVILIFVYFIKVNYKNSEGRDIEQVLDMDAGKTFMYELEQNYGIKSKFSLIDNVD